ncbi:MAG TPA: glycoside hydrolase family 3 protein [Acidimicrobiales bacterium]
MLGSTTRGWTIEADEAVEPIESGFLAGLSLDEKADLTGGADIWHTVAVKRRGIPSLLLSDGPAGVRGPRFSGDTSVCVPCGTALAATWDRELVRRIGGLLGDEARARGVHVLLAPTVNLHRHPLGGRNFECFSEDPHLTAELAVAYIEGVQSRGVGCAVKHFVANDQEHDRMEVSVEVDERTLREVYLAPFEAAVRRADVWAVMAAYNRLHGVHCSEHAGLLEGILRGDWGFEGVVVSDWYGTHSTAAAAAGLDLEMPGPPEFLGHLLAAAVRQGDLPESVLDRAAGRLLGLIDRAVLAPTSLSTEPEPEADADPAELTKEAAAEAIVLLSNDGVLPLAPSEDPTRPLRIAVIGPKADRPDIQGGGSAHVQPPYVVTPLEALTARAESTGGTVTIRHEPGVPLLPAEPLERRVLRVPGEDQAGLRVEHFAGHDLRGPALHTEVLPETQLFWLGPPVPGVSPDEYSVRAVADFVPESSGIWSLNLSSAGRSRVRVDGHMVLDNMKPVRGDTFFGRGSVPIDGTIELQAGTSYRLVIELYGQARSATWVSGVVLTARPPEEPDAQARAVAAAADADVALVLIGADRADSEGGDRTDLDLPADQEALVRAVAAVNERTVVVVNCGSPVTLDWADDVAAVAYAWYLGQEGGHALASVLFGDRDAAGRLPTTLPQRLEDTPAFPYYPGEYGRAPYTEGVLVGYRHYDAYSLEPRFCFGHGLSYTEFRYGDLSVEPGELPEDPVVVTVEVTNVGERSGREVVQLYVRDQVASVSRPERELKDFAKIGLAPGETTPVRFELGRPAFAFWDTHRHDWLVEPGEFEIAVGSSSRAIQASAALTL